MKIYNKALASRPGRRSTVIFVLALFAASIIQTKAQVYSISAANASLQIDLAGPNAGLSDWAVNNNVSQLNQQWFYYSIGSGPLQSIDTISPWTTPTGNTSSLTEIYSDSSVKATAGFSLGPVGVGQSQLSTSLALQNLTGTNGAFHLYQFSYFDLGGISGGQNVQFLQTGPTYNMIQTGHGVNLTGYLSALGGGGLLRSRKSPASITVPNLALQMGIR